MAVVREFRNDACNELNFRSGVYRQREPRDEHELKEGKELRDEQELSFRSRVYLQSEPRDEQEPGVTLDSCKDSCLRRQDCTVRCVHLEPRP